LKITLNQLNHFIVLGKELHFRRAAELCDIAQPILSRSIQSLERELGFDLLKRDNRNVELTETGRAFLESAQLVARSLDSSIIRARRAIQTELSQVRVGFSYVSICGESLPKILNAFQKNNSDINLESVSTQSNDILERLHHDELDFGFLTKSTNFHGLDYAPFQTNRYTVLVHQDHPLAATGKITLEQLQQEKVLLSGAPEREIFRQQVLKMIQKTGYELNIELLFQRPQSVIDFVVLGEGVAIFVDNISLPNDDRTTMLELLGVEDSMETVIAWKGDQLSDVNQKFLKFVLDSLRKSNPENSELLAPQSSTSSKVLAHS